MASAVAVGAVGAGRPVSTPVVGHPGTIGSARPGGAP
jgi:hypothetical protein